MPPKKTAAPGAAL
jgi:hypothetical protein